MKAHLIPLLHLCLACAVSLTALTSTAVAAGASTASTQPTPTIRDRRVEEVFDYRKPVIFQDDFQSTELARWKFSENDRFRLPAADPDRIKVIESLGPRGRQAVRFAVPRGPNSFRSEIALPTEQGFQERWYGARLMISPDWIFDEASGDDIVLQWHAVPGNWRATHPNLAISVHGDRWRIRQTFGSAQTNPSRTDKLAEGSIAKGTWVSWVVHARWSPDEDGLMEVWKDGVLVLKRSGTNVYGTIGLAYTPRLQTGIYHPQWHLNDERKWAAYDQTQMIEFNRVTYLTNVKVGDERATYNDVAPIPDK